MHKTNPDGTNLKDKSHSSSSLHRESPATNRMTNQNNNLKTSIFEYRKHLEQVEEILNELFRHSQDGDIFVVEGKRDIRSLKKLGIDGDIETVSNKSLLNFSEDIAYTGKCVVILTDWDRRGEILASKLSEYLQTLDVDYDVEIREQLKSLVKKEIKDIESLYNYVMKLRSITGTTSDFTDFADEFDYYIYHYFSW